MDEKNTSTGTAATQNHESKRRKFSVGDMK
jgi:hypothetical protein